MNNKPITLALETGIGGGSFSILEDGREIDFWVGENKMPGAESVLIQIENFLEKNGISKKRIKLIAVSSGPGSFTGLRVGLALAKGLRKALGCELKLVSVLKAIALEIEPEKNRIIAIPIGNKQICHQRLSVDGYTSSSDKQKKISSAELFFNELDNLKNREKIVLILHSEIIHKNEMLLSEGSLDNFYKLIKLANLAKFIGKHAEYENDLNASDNVIDTIDRKTNNLIYLSEFTNN